MIKCDYMKNNNLHASLLFINYDVGSVLFFNYYFEVNFFIFIIIIFLERKKKL